MPTETVRIYDPNNNLKEERLANGLVMRYDYDGLGRRTKIIYPDQSFAVYLYNPFHLKKVIRFNAQGKPLYNHVYKEYDLSGNLLTAQLPGAAGQWRQDYDRLNRPILLQAPSWREAAFDYDPVGNLLRRTVEDPEGSIACKYTYDDLYQLKSERGIASHDYLNDSRCNHIQIDTDKRIHNDVNQLRNDGQTTYEYECNGNLFKMTSGEEACTFTYDALDRLCTVNSQVEYTYDAFNRRLSKKTDEEEVRYFYIDQNEVGAVDANGEIIELRVLGKGMGSEIGAAVVIELQGQVYVPIHDHCGNCVSLLDMQGHCVESYRYSAFGQEHLSQAVINPWRYSSKRYDPETGFVYFGERYYSPKMCRWVTPDPIGFEGGTNLYTFLNNNPLNLADFYGLYPEKFSDLHFSLEEDMNHFDEGIFARGFGVGAWKGFSDFTGALNNQANLVTGFGQMCYNRDFSSLSFGNLDVKNTVGFLGERTGEVAGQVAFMASAVLPIYQLGKLGLQRFVLPNLSRGVSSAFGNFVGKEVIGGAYNMAAFEEYKISLRAQMEKPHAIDLQLQKLLDLNFRQNANIGNGSTATAIRYELSTGNSVGGRFHSQKGRELIKSFETWLRKNPTATTGDRAAAENIIKDLKNALGE